MFNTQQTLIGNGPSADSEHQISVQFELGDPTTDGSIPCFMLLLHRFQMQGVFTSNRVCVTDVRAFHKSSSASKKFGTISVLKDTAWPSPDDEIKFWERDFPAWDVNAHTPIYEDKDSDPMHVIHVTAEMAPIAKVGGLGDVVTGLARACLLRGHKVDIMLPFYECIQKEHIDDLELSSTYNSFHDGKWVPTNAYRGVVSGIPVIFIDPENNFFKGKSVYGGSYNELEAYIFFSRACLEWMQQVTGTQPDIIHVHEWQTGALSLLYWDMYHYLSVKKPRLLLTIHNMEHYGECRFYSGTKPQVCHSAIGTCHYVLAEVTILMVSICSFLAETFLSLQLLNLIVSDVSVFVGRVEQLNKCGLDGSLYATIDKAVDDRTIGHNPERLSLLKGGIVYSNAVVYHGILNGIDTTFWNPATDVFLPANFSEVRDYANLAFRYHEDSLFIEKIISEDLVFSITSAHYWLAAQDIKGKKICKQYIQRGLGLAIKSTKAGVDAPNNTNRVPLVVCITRLVAQKGLHLIQYAVKRVEELGGQMVLLGKAPDVRVERDFENLANTVLSHMLYAAADMVLVPSMYEPCGLAQMIGMRYGAVPVVRKTGGLADTVFDMDDQSNPDNANGYVFEGIDERSLNWAMERAFLHYKDKPDEWNALVQKVMEVDSSWNNTAGKYIDVYNSIRGRE
ncbi:hypothetical protein ACLOJK_030894 [Asimina triloba]